MERDNKNEIIIMGRVTKSIITALATVLFLAFGFLKLRGVPVGEIIGNVSDDVIVKIALFIYYTSWVWGTINDANEQETAYAVAPNKGRLPRQGVAICIGTAAVFGLLCCVGSASVFSVILFVFLAFNVYGYRYLKKTVMPAVTASQEHYEKEGKREGRLKLQIVTDYMFGKWQWYRFGYGFVAAVTLMVMSFSQLPQLLNSQCPAIPAKTFLALSVLFYVLTFEGWIWIMRIWVKIAQHTITFVLEFPDAKVRQET